MDRILKDTPDYLLDIMSKVIRFVQNVIRLMRS